MAHDNILNKRNPGNIDSSKFINVFKSKGHEYLGFIYSDKTSVLNAAVLLYNLCTSCWMSVICCNLKLEQTSSQMRITEISQVRLKRNYLRV